MNWPPAAASLLVLCFILLSVLVFNHGHFHWSLQTLSSSSLTTPPPEQPQIPNLQHGYKNRQPLTSIRNRVASHCNDTSACNARARKVKIRDHIEAGLRQARADIRRATRWQNYSSAVTETFLPKGDIYHNPYAFYQSYIEMEKRFRIWSYREDMFPLGHRGPLKAIYAVEGHILAELDGSLGLFAAARPEDAHVFYLPLSVANVIMYVYGSPVEKTYKPLRRVWEDYVHAIAAKHQFWNRSDGADHFMAACHDWGPWITVNHRLYKNLIRLVCNANVSEGFNPSRDASIPEVHIHGDNLSPPDHALRPSQRPYLAFFAGGAHGDIRKMLLNHWKDKDAEVIVHEYLPRNINYDKMMRRSRFCLCPSGYEVASPRHVEAIYAGCVPVIISQGFVLPFSDVLDWSKFSVSVPVEKIPEIKTILQGISPEQYARMQRRVIKVQRHFVINRPAKRFDLIHMAIHSVWLRRLNLRLHY